jgi:predicted metal-dependent enzyme (double-stranded beta helix superfamily)
VLTTTATRPHSRLEADALADIATALLDARQIWQDAVRFDPQARRPVRLLADDVFEAWVIGWCAGQALGLHDHGDSVGAIVVADGRLHETSVGPAGTRLHVLDRGIVHRIHPQTVHSVSNFESRSATSLHVYSPPLDRMTHFDPTDGRAVETVNVDPETPLLPAAVGQLLRISQHI